MSSFDPNRPASSCPSDKIYLKQACFSHCLCDQDLVDFDLYLALYGVPNTDGYEQGKLNVGQNMETCLVKELNIDFLELRAGKVKAVIKIDDVHCRTTPIGPILHGGTSLAFAETLAGVASMALCKAKEHPVGVSVSGNHLAMAYKGQSLVALCTLIHKGSSSHLWNVDLTNDDGRLISTVRVTNAIIKG